MANDAPREAPSGPLDPETEAWLAAVAARLAACTPGPWMGAPADAEYHDGLVAQASSGGTIARVDYGAQTGAHQPDGDLALIAAAPTDLARAVALIRALEAENVALFARVTMSAAPHRRRTGRADADLSA